MRFLFLLSPLIIVSIFLFVILIPVLLGVYVYKDADKRGMNPLLWVLIVVLVPGLIGFILYLIFRGSNEGLRNCPNCNSVLDRNYDVCPNCLFPLENNSNYSDGTKKRNNLLIILIILALIIPVLIVLAIAFFNFSEIQNDYEVFSYLLSFMI